MKNQSVSVVIDVPMCCEYTERLKIEARMGLEHLHSTSKEPDAKQLLEKLSISLIVHV